MNIYLSGVGGQGIGMLSETLLRAADHAGLKVNGVDTHGLAQRGGVVVSQLRIGDAAHSPLIRTGDADLVIALERHEAVRAAGRYLKEGGSLIYYDAVWQPLDVRLNLSPEAGKTLFQELSRQRNAKIYRVFDDSLEIPRMQNIVLLADICRLNLIPAVKKSHYQRAMEDLMAGTMLETNLALFEKKSV